MKKLAFAIAVLALATAPAFAQAPVNIVYPVDGGTYPITGPAVGVLNSAYFTSSFSVTCPGGPRTAEWGFDSTSVGKATFYDQFTSQFVHKLGGGSHTFWVISSCGDSRVKFEIGN
jgi:hypothetical protein